MTETLTPTPRSRARRLFEKSTQERAAVDAILDAMPVCHVGYILDGAPIVTPTFQWREGDRVYWHGSSASRLMRQAADSEVCLTVTLIDGLVLARSGLEHSVSYRSVMLFGRAETVTEPAAKERHLERFMEHILPGRWAALRPVNAQELKATAILSMPILEGSAKISAGMPTDLEADLSWPVWAGIIPIQLVVGAPEPDPRNLPGLETPAHATAYRIGDPA